MFNDRPSVVSVENLTAHRAYGSLRTHDSFSTHSSPPGLRRSAMAPEPVQLLRPTSLAWADADSVFDKRATQEEEKEKENVSLTAAPKLGPEEQPDQVAPVEASPELKRRIEAEARGEP